MASGSSDKSIKLWNITNGKLIRNLTGHTNFILNSVDFLSNSQTLVSGSYWDQSIKIWNITTGQSKRTLTSHTRAIKWSIDLTNSGQTMVSGGSDSDQTIKLWNWKTGECLNTINTSLNITSLASIKSKII